MNIGMMKLASDNILHCLLLPSGFRVIREDLPYFGVKEVLYIIDG